MMRGHRTPRSMRRHGQNPWRLRTAALIAGCLIIFLAVVFIHRSLQLRDLRRELDRIHAEQAVALKTQADLRGELARQDDPDAIEERARRLLGWVMPGEEKVLFIGGE